MLRTITTTFLALFCVSLFAQLNSTLRDQLDYSQAVNDVWGYVAPDGTEYAIVGTDVGVSFVSLSNPDSIYQVAFIDGDRSPWRDMKTYGEFAYAVADVGNDGLVAFDLRGLPDTVIATQNTYDVPGSSTVWDNAHNIYIDTVSGRAFTAGGSRNIIDGGILIFDLIADPASPTLIGQGPPTYSHDVFVLGDTMYCSEIYDGELALYEIGNLDSIYELGTTLTPFAFTHNAWTTDDGRYVFTTDERANAPVAVYDVADKDDIQELDEFRPLASILTGTIPHNVHVIDDYLSISYYTDGLVVADASVPDNVVEVANYDTWLGPNGDFNGAWGAYPFLPSGLTLVSDRETGLYVIDVDYKRAARIHGTVTDAQTGDAINNASFFITADQLNFTFTDALGRYATGIATGGTYVVNVMADGYRASTQEVQLTNGGDLELNVQLGAKPQFSFNINVVAESDEGAVAGANVSLRGRRAEDGDFTAVADADGMASFTGVFEGEYDVIISAWGYEYALDQVDDLSALASGENKVYRLERGYVDDFISDLGWSITGSALRGSWERGTPVATNFNGVFQPGNDAPGDLGEQCYFTDPSGGGAGDGDVDGGNTIITSPVFDGTFLDSAVVSYQYYFANDGGNSNPDDEITVSISNGTDTELVSVYATDARAWIADSFRIDEFLTPTETMTIAVETSDSPNSGHLVEAGFDNFRLSGVARTPVSTEERFGNDIDVSFSPNPTADRFLISYDLKGLKNLNLRLIDATGRVVMDRQLGASVGQLSFGRELAAGFYFAEILAGKERVYSGKLVKR